jgi:NAD(P)-dependent dehydrogenase (short-subunit alcohol dehydrogenase family)
VAGGARGLIVNWSRNRDDAERLAAELSDSGVPALAVRADVRDGDEVTAMVRRTLDEFGRLDHLVNNAGATRLIPFADLDGVTDADWDTVFGVNIQGAFNCMRAAAPALRAAHGSVVNVASISAHRGIGSSIPYGVSKAGLVQLTRSMATVLAPEVRVNSVSPGTVSTGWLGALLGDDVARRNAEKESSLIPLGKVAGARDVAEVILDLLASGFVTGQDIIVDGGKHLRY